MRARLAVVVPVLAGVALLLGIGGGTYAAFTDTESAAPTLVGAGTLDLRLSSGTGSDTEPVTLRDLRPEPPGGPDGASEHHYLVRVTNDGTTAGTARWATAPVAELEHGCNATELDADDSSCGTGPEEGELGGQLRVSLSSLPGADCVGNPEIGAPATFPATAESAFHDVIAGPSGDALVLEPGEGRCLRVDVHLPVLPANNLAQGDSSTFRLQFRLDQAI